MSDCWSRGSARHTRKGAAWPTFLRSPNETTPGLPGSSSKKRIPCGLWSNQRSATNTRARWWCCITERSSGRVATTWKPSKTHARNASNGRLRSPRIPSWCSSLSPNRWNRARPFFRLPLEPALRRTGLYPPGEPDLAWRPTPVLLCARFLCTPSSTPGAAGRDAVLSSFALARGRAFDWKGAKRTSPSSGRSSRPCSILRCRLPCSLPTCANRIGSCVTRLAPKPGKERCLSGAASPVWQRVPPCGFGTPGRTGFDRPAFARASAGAGPGRATPRTPPPWLAVPDPLRVSRPARLFADPIPP